MKKPTWQSLQNRIGGRFLAPSQQLFANGVMVGDNNKNMNPTGNLTRAQACVLISKSLFKLSEFGSIIDPYLPAPDATAEVNVTYSNQEFSKYGGKGYTVNILEDGIYRLINNSPEVRMYVYRDKKEILPQYDCYALTKDSENVLYLSGENEDRGAFKLQKEEFTISNVNYNNSTPKLGINNVVTLDIEKNTAGTGVYKVALYCAPDSTSEGGVRSASKTVTLNGTESSTVTFEDVALYGGGSGQIYTYAKVALFNDSDGYLAKSNRVQKTISGVLPQEIKFSNWANKENEYVIFDDHPEFIRECDLLDSTYFAPAVLNHVDDMEVGGTYTLFSYHHIANSHSPDGLKKGANNEINDDHDVYFDVVFHGNGSIKITKLGYAYGGLPGDAWDELNYVFPEFNSSLLSHQVDLLSESIFLTDLEIMENSMLKINEYNNNGTGFSHVILQFEVLSGTVNLSTVAYKNKGNAGAPGTAKGNFSSSIKSTYEKLETLKGTANSTQVLASDIMNFVIDDSVQSNFNFPFIVKNQIYPNGRINGIFSTNSSPLTANNSYMTPLSSVPVLEYYGNGIIRNKDTGNVQEIILFDTETPWLFDSSHSRFVESYDLTDEMKFGPYENKQSFSTNEMLSSDWMNQLSTLTGSTYTNVFGELDGLASGNLANGKGIVSVNPGFGHTYEINFRICNLGTTTRRFNYYLAGGLSHASWRYTVCNPDIDWTQAWTEKLNFDYDTNSRIDARGENVTKPVMLKELEIPAGKCVNVQAWITVYTGSNPVIQNAIVLDPINEFNINVTELSVGYPQN